jgi:hypothetical protein
MRSAERPKLAELTDAEIGAAESACQGLALEYAETVDAREYARLREVFAEDAIFARPTDPANPIHGLENIVASFESRPHNRLTQHFVTNVRVHVNRRRRRVAHAVSSSMFPTLQSQKHLKEGKRRPSKSSECIRTATCARRMAGELSSAAARLCSILSAS